MLNCHYKHQQCFFEEKITCRHASRAFAAAMDSMTKVAVRKDMKASRMRMTEERR